MYAADNPTFSNRNKVTFFVDIDREATSGVNYVPITITCLDPYNQERTNTVTVPLNINVPPPRFMISDVTTTSVGPNRMFTMTMKVYNCGGSDAENIQIMFNGSSNMFSAADAVKTKDSIPRFGESEFTFEILANDIDEGQIYHPTFFVSFEDELGNEYPFSGETEQTVSIRADVPEPEPESIWDINMGLAVVMFGIFILIGVIIAVFVYHRVSKPDFGNPKEPKPKKEKTPKPAPAPQPEPAEPAPAPTPQPAPAYEQQTPPPPPPTYQAQQPPQRGYQQQGPPPRPPRQY
jgi:hypothetical protein